MADRDLEQAFGALVAALGEATSDEARRGCALRSAEAGGKRWARFARSRSAAIGQGGPGALLAQAAALAVDDPIAQAAEAWAARVRPPGPWLRALDRPARWAWDGAAQGVWAHQLGAVAAALHPDGGEAFSAGDESFVQRWLVDRGEVAPCPMRHDGGVRAVAVSPGGAWVASGGIGGLVCSLPLREPSGVGRYLQLHDRMIDRVAVDDAGLVVSWDNAGTLLASDGPHPLPFKARQAYAAGLALPAALPGHALAAGWNDLILWNMHTSEARWRIDPGDDSFCALAIDRAGRVAVLGCGSGRLLRVALDDAKKPPVELGKHGAPVRALGVDAQAGRVLAGDADGVVRLWDGGGKGCLATLQGHTLQVTAASLDARGVRGLSAGEDGWLRSWDLSELPATAPPHPGSSRWAALLPEAGWGARVRCDLQGSMLVERQALDGSWSRPMASRPSVPARPLWAVSFGAHGDGSAAALCFDDQLVEIHEVGPRQRGPRRVPIEGFGVSLLALDPRRRRLYLTRREPTQTTLLECWDERRLTLRWSAPALAQSAIELVLSDDEVLAASEHEVAAWDASTGEERWRWTPGGRVLTLLAGRVVTWPRAGDAVDLWNLSTQKVSRRIAVGVAPRRVAMHEHLSLIAAVGWDGSVAAGPQRGGPLARWHDEADADQVAFDRAGRLIVGDRAGALRRFAIEPSARR